MPAIVRGGRTQAGSRGVKPRGGQVARPPAMGGVDMPTIAVSAAAMAGAVVLIVLMATGSRADRIGQATSDGLDRLAVSMGLTLDRVHLTGASPEATPAIRQALALSRGQAMTGLDLDALQARVERVGWVRDARVVRLLPGTLIVEVEEHDRLAVWQTGGRAHVIDASGQVIQGAQAGLYPELPLVVGAGADRAAGAILPLLAQRSRLMTRVEALVRVDDRRWDLRLRDGGLIQLPATDQEAALLRLDALDQRSRVLELGLSRIDLRTPDEIAVRPSTPSTPADQA